MLANLNVEAELFHTASGAIRRLMIDGHRNWAVRSARFRSWLRHNSVKENRRSRCRGHTVFDLLEPELSSMGRSGTIHTIRTTGARRPHLSDLADDHWRAVEIGPDGGHRHVRP
jgi:hypothetical protein